VIFSAIFANFSQIYIFFLYLLYFLLILLLLNVHTFENQSDMMATEPGRYFLFDFHALLHPV